MKIIVRGNKVFLIKDGVIMASYPSWVMFNNKKENVK